MAGEIVHRDVDQYIYDLLPARDAVLWEMERYAAKHHVPIVGPAVGALLALLVEMTGARRIFEMGSAIGYSTLWLARAAGPRGRVFYTDSDPENARRAAAWFRRAGVEKRIRIFTGDALRLLARTPGRFDFIFNDVDKHDYPAVFRKAVPRLKRGGLLVTDNVLWSGQVARGARDVETRAIRELNRMMYASREVSTTIIPLRDGVAVCRKR